jgi:membrane protease YdiL (CAAX protease family)
MLMQWPLFSHFAAARDEAYRITFFLVQLSLVFGSAAFLSRRHAPAIWTPQPLLRRGILASLVILLPLLLNHLADCFVGIQGAIALSGLGSEGTKTLTSIYHDVWGSLAYGSSLAGVACSSIMSIAAPVLEEVVFTGFLVNAIAKSYGFVVAVLIVPACFALVHGFQFGFGVPLFPLYFAGVTYAAIRLYSGSLLLAVFGHCTVNAVIFLPKWVIAVMHFTRV